MSLKSSINQAKEKINVKDLLHNVTQSEKKNELYEKMCCAFELNLFLGGNS